MPISGILKIPYNVNSKTESTIMHYTQAMKQACIACNLVDKIQENKVIHQAK